MWIVVERSKNNPESCWFSGVFLKEEDLKSYLSTLPDRPTETREVREIPVYEYPVMFVYDANIKDITYVTLEQLSHRLFNIEKVKDNGHEYCKYFVFKQDYRGFSPDEKYYTWDNKHHVINPTLQGLLTTGLRVSRLGTMEGIYCCGNCDREESGILSEKGYEPPAHWLIFKTKDSKFTVACSEKCKSLIQNN